MGKLETIRDFDRKLKEICPEANLKYFQYDEDGEIVEIEDKSVLVTFLLRNNWLKIRDNSQNVYFKADFGATEFQKQFLIDTHESILVS